MKMGSKKREKDGGKKVKFNQVGGKLLKKHSSNSDVFKLKTARPEVLVFDRAAREDYVTGFQKRKTQRKIQGAEIVAAKAKRERLQERKERRDEQQKAVEAARAQRATLLGDDDGEDGDDSTESSDDEAKADKVSTDATMQFEGGTSSVVVITEAIAGPKDELEEAQNAKKAAYEVRKAKEAKEAARERHKPKNKTYIKKGGGIRHRGKTQSKRAKKKK